MTYLSVCVCAYVATHGHHLNIIRCRIGTSSFVLVTYKIHSMIFLDVDLIFSLCVCVSVCIIVYTAVVRCPTDWLILAACSCDRTLTNFRYVRKNKKKNLAQPERDREKCYSTLSSQQCLQSTKCHSSADYLSVSVSVRCVYAVLSVAYDIPYDMSAQAITCCSMYSMYIFSHFIFICLFGSAQVMPSSFRFLLRTYYSYKCA